MGKKITGWKTKGMNRDLSVSAFNPEFAFENMNLRLATNEGNTTMSWVNERGTRQLPLEIDIDPWEDTGADKQPPESVLVGWPIGTAVINDKLVIFTTQNVPDTVPTGKVDRIYVLWYDDEYKDRLVGKMLYSGNLNFDVSHPLETLVSYETESIQKVYWVDGKNQPRLINIAGNFTSEVDPTYFDFVNTLQLKEKVTVKKHLGASGMFAPGVIQYAFTYYNKNAQETNIFYTTPLLYISHPDRGGSPEDKISNAFTISISGMDTHFDYLRIYSIQRTSINGTPICKRLQDILLKDLVPSSTLIEVATLNTSIPLTDLPIPDYTDVSKSFGLVAGTLCMGFTKAFNPNLVIETSQGKVTWSAEAGDTSVIWITNSPVLYNGQEVYCVFETVGRDGTVVQEMQVVEASSPDVISYTDTGISGNAIDPTELLYKGGYDIVASTLEQKDGTLFLGNISNGIRKALNPKDVSGLSILEDPYYRDFKPLEVSSQNYKYASQLSAVDNNGNSVPCAGFKYGDKYRCGVQFQYKTGKWSAPTWIKDASVPNSPKPNDSNIQVPVLRGRISSELSQFLKDAGYLRARAVVVFPNVQDRITICQGVACPTLYTERQRKTDKNIYAQSSWFFRPKANAYYNNGVGTVTPTSEAYLAYTSRSMGVAEIQESAGTRAVAAQDSSVDDLIAGGGASGSAGTSGGGYNPGGSTNIRQVEIQGSFSNDNKFQVDTGTVTLHSPEIEFDTQLYSTDFSGFIHTQVGKAKFLNTFSDIDIQTETPVSSNTGSGFIHKSFIDSSAFGIVSGLFYEDFLINDSNTDTSDKVGAYDEERSPLKWMVYLWNKTGSLNNDINRTADDGVATAKLKKKVISNLRFTETDYITGYDVLTGADTKLFSSDEPTIVKLNQNDSTKSNVYMGNIDTILNPDYAEGMYFMFNSLNIQASEVHTGFATDSIWWKTFYDQITNGQESMEGTLWHKETVSGVEKWTKASTDFFSRYRDCAVKRDFVRMKYKSTPHLVSKLGSGGLDWTVEDDSPTLPVVDVRRTEPTTMFGGTSIDALRENVWTPCGEPVRLGYDTEGNETGYTEFEYSYGDTYYQRYDCLKTYAFTKEDENQVVEIGSFMLETHVNIDGRYDRNRGQLSNLNMSPVNFNLINPVYSQTDNFFTYKIMPEEYYRDTKYPNQITWSKTKSSDADVDMWTNITLASVLELDGDKGEVRSLNRLNDQLICFQDSGISQILYNERAQITTEQGVPIELGDSGKVQGKRYLSNTVGCSNKWSIVSTPAGLYFMDSNDKSIYRLGDGLQNVSQQVGFNSWCKQNIPSAGIKWTPQFPGDSNGKSAFVGFYDCMNQDVLFVNRDMALAYSEKFGVFTSFYSYGDTPLFENITDTGIWIKANGDVWKHQDGEYCDFFGTIEPYWMTLIGNPEPQADKTFTNIEFRATVEGDGMETSRRFNPFLPFDYLETWNEYQHGMAQLGIKNGQSNFFHHPTNGDTDASIKRKFRIWRCDIPRDNAPLSSDDGLGISRMKPHPVDRMRNPWLYLKLKKDVADGEALNKAEIHDVIMTYFV